MSKTSKRKNPFTDPDMQQYFSALPAITQESIAQSGVKFESAKQLREFVNGLDQSKRG